MLPRKRATPGDAVADVDGVVLLQLVPLVRRQDGEDHVLDLLRRERVGLEGHEPAVDAKERRTARLQMEIRGLLLRDELQKLGEIHLDVDSRVILLQQRLRRVRKPSGSAEARPGPRVRRGSPRTRERGRKRRGRAPDAGPPRRPRADRISSNERGRVGLRIRRSAAGRRSILSGRAGQRPSLASRRRARRKAVDSSSKGEERRRSAATSRRVGRAPRPVQREREEAAREPQLFPADFPPS